MTRKKIVTIVALIAAAALAMKGKELLKSRQAEIANAAVPAAKSVTVPVVEAREGTVQKRVSVLAQVLGDKHIQLSTKLAGYVEKVHVEEAQRVKKGEVLVSIDATELRSNIDALGATQSAQRNDLALAKRIHERNRKLYAVGGLAKEKLDISRVSVKVKASVLENTAQKIAQLEHQLSYLQIVAPFDGEIDRIMLHEGDLAASGRPILSMSNTGKKLLFSYAPSLQAEIKKGERVQLARKTIGRVKSIYGTSTNGLTSAEVVLDEEIGLPLGSSVTVEVLVKEAKGCTLPDDTLLHKKEGVFVMEYNEGRFTPLKVTLEVSDAGRVVVSPCPKAPVARASEVKLAALPAYEHVTVQKAEK
jgi:RND family efflux transporter MFP subunit